MGHLDDILIDKVSSPLCGRLHHHLGICQWRAAIECLNGSIACYLAAVAFEIAARSPEQAVFPILLRALVWLLIMDHVRRRAWRQAASSIGVRTARFGEGIFRLILVAATPLSLCFATSLDNLFYSAALLLLTGHLYLKASDAPPPEPRGRLARQRG